MKDSGVIWIGDIPDNWEIRKLKYILSYRNESNNPIKTDFILSLTNDRGVIPYEERGNQGNISKNDLSGYKIAYPNDILVNCMNISIGSVGLSNYYGCVSPVYYPFYIIKNKGDIRFYNYLFHTSQFQKIISIVGKGIMEIRMRVSVSQINENLLPIPPIDEQKKIADFLDEKSVKIDSVIEKEKSLIDKYKEYKKSLITEAVTKGLDPSVPLKDTGILWLGSIPSHWEVKPLKYCARTRNNKYNETYGILKYIGLENVEGYTGRFVETNNEYDLEGSNVANKNDIAFGKLRPYLAKVYLVKEQCCLSSEFAIFYNFKGIQNYYKFLFLSDWFIKIVNSSTYGTKMPRANITFINNMLLPIPPLAEQKEIADYLDNKCEKIDNIIELKEKKIEKLQDFKKSLIYEYVTGKKQVI